jgi:secondary thiamine-phosphate synthase enzyme
MAQIEPVVTDIRVYQEVIEIATQGKGFTDITERVSAVVARSGVHTGLCTLFIKHTSASLIIQENADPAVLRDLERWMADLVPESLAWEHDEEGPDDMPAHVRAVLTHTSETIPITAGRLSLGQWQAIYLWEHRSRNHRRNIVVNVSGQ